MLTKTELKYLEACMQVADGEGEHAAEFGLDCGALQVKLQEEICRADDPQTQRLIESRAEEYFLETGKRPGEK